jgi:hypothetical protein
MKNPPQSPKRVDAWRTGLWPGAGVLAVAVVLGLGFGAVWSPAQPPMSAPEAQRQVGQAATSPGGSPAASPVQQQPPVPRQAQFGEEPASRDARQTANWALYSGDNQSRGVVVVDKKDAKVFVFDRDGALQGAAPALMGSAIGDHSVPGVGDKPVAQVLPEERTTPAGRFIAEVGLNANGEDVVWVDYDAAVSMHRVRANVKSERRLERLASSTAADNRISFGCINLPVTFYEKVLSPLVRGTGAVVYVLPETQPAAALFGAYDVPSMVKPAR